MSARRPSTFVSIRTEGALLTPELLARIARQDSSLPALQASSYGLPEGERLADAIQRAWTRVRSQWGVFQKALEKIPALESATPVTREKWLIPLFDALGFGRLALAPSAALGDRSFPVSHAWGAVPIHLVGARVPLDRRSSGLAGAARTSPHGLVQEFLNHSDDRLFGIVTNGITLRLLRDNAALTRQSYVEFDLQALMEGEVYADFLVLFLLLHVSRFEGTKPEECVLEQWVATAKEQGTRALDRLRDGVALAIESLGGGFLSHPKNDDLRSRLRSGELSAQDYYRQVLRFVYRLLFLFVAEDRELLLDPKAPSQARERYDRWYSTHRLRRLALRRTGTSHDDLYAQLRLVMEKLGADSGCPELGLPPLGSFLWSPEALPDLHGAVLSNHALLDAFRAITVVSDGRHRRNVDWRNLGPEELGSVYESLLELHPAINTEAATFSLASASGNERKTTGSYYTPDSLIQCLLDSALDPVLDAAAKSRDPAAAILALKVCDPACGSGHFLIAAAHRLAKRLAAARAGDEEPAPPLVRTALRDVIGRCLYGVDLNPMAVELCRVNLWMEALEPGRPLSFLDGRIVCGNSLLGTTPALLSAGIPDEAFTPLAGDDKKVASEFKKTNRLERRSRSEVQSDLFATAVAEPGLTYQRLSEESSGIAALSESTITDLHTKERRFNEFRRSAGLLQATRVADTWCAAFVWPKHARAEPPPTQDIFERIQSGRPVSASTLQRVDHLAQEFRFFHWHLAFPEVFSLPTPPTPADNPEAGWSGGFDCVLGNPPWERVKLQEQEWFAARRPDIAKAKNAAARKKAIEELRCQDPTLFSAFESAQRTAEGESHLIRSSNRFPLCGRGDVNTYTVFAELNRNLLAPRGLLGCIVPSGIATDDTTKVFFGDLVTSRALVSLYDFENREGIFPAVDSRMKFCLLTSARQRPSESPPTTFAFFLQTTADLRDVQRRFALSPEDLLLLNPNTRTCPVFRSRRDAEITKAIYRRIPVLVREGPPEENSWAISFSRLFDMSNDSGLFRSRRELESSGFHLEGNAFTKGPDRFLPLYEAKMLHHFDHRFGDYADHPEGSENTSLPVVSLSRLADPSYSVLPRYWVPASEVDDRLRDRWPHGWLLGFRDICRNTDERTVIASVLPRVGVGHKAPLLHSKSSVRHQSALIAALCSLALDYTARQKFGSTSLTYFVLKQLPIVPPAAICRTEFQVDTSPQGSARSNGPGDFRRPASHPILDWIVPRVLELVYTAHELAPFARDLGYSGPPFPFDPERRFQIRCELDALFFHLYGLSRDDTFYILDTFPIVRRNEEKLFGSFRTKSTILALYDTMTLVDRPPSPVQSPG